jgi:hypothetical protein
MTNTIAFPSSPSASLFALLASAELVTIDGGSYVADWEISQEIGEHDNQVILFSWHDGGQFFSRILTEGGIAAGHFKEDCFVCDDHEGEPTVIRFFKIKEIKPHSPQGDAPPFPVIVHARRLIEKVDRAYALRKAGSNRVTSEDWKEFADIANDLRVALESV